jgi:hypothetical protein
MSLCCSPVRLLARQFGWHHHPEVNVEISPAATVDVGHSRSAQPDHLSGLRTGIDRDLRLLAENGGDWHLCAEHGLEDRNRELEVEIRAIALEEIVFFEGHHHEEIAGGSAQRAALTLAHQPQPHAGIDSGRHRDLERGLLFDASSALTVTTRISIHPTAAAAGGAGLGDGQKAAPERHLARALAGVAGFRGCSGLRSGARAALAAFKPRNADRPFDSRRRLLEAELQGVLEIVSTLRPLTTAPPPGAEDVAETEGSGHNETACRRPTAPHRPPRLP